jgi:uncharacterized lipoprotein
MNPRSASLRPALAIGLAVCVALVSGCSWFRAASPYEQSPENRPLEVPPDLSLPNTTQAMRIPETPAAAPVRAPAAASQAFVLADDKASAWRRVGLALDRIDGVSVGERVELAGVFNVSYRGESLLIRLAPEGAGTRVAAVNSGGAEATSAAASSLLGELRQRLM